MFCHVTVAETSIGYGCYTLGWEARSNWQSTSVVSHKQNQCCNIYPVYRQRSFCGSTGFKHMGGGTILCVIFVLLLMLLSEFFYLFFNVRIYINVGFSWRCTYLASAVQVFVETISRWNWVYNYTSYCSSGKTIRLLSCLCFPLTL